MGNIGPHCLIQHAGDDRAVGYCADYFLNYYAYFGIYFLALGYFMGGGARAIYTHGKAKSKHPWGFVILAALFLYSPVLLLSFPSAVKNVDKKNKKTC